MTLHFKSDDLVPYILTESGQKRSIRVVADTLYIDTAIQLSDGQYYPTTPCIPELIDIVDAALNDGLLGSVKDTYTVSCVLLHANMGGSVTLFDWTNSKKKYIISMREVHGRMINMEVAGLTYDSAKNKILILLTIARTDGDRFAYYLRSRY